MSLAPNGKPDRTSDPKEGGDKPREKGPPENKKIREELELFESIFDSLFNGAVITDPDGNIIRINKPYCKFLGMEAGECIGRHCTEIVENTRLHIVGKTGKAELNHTQVIKDQSILVHRIPIKKEGKVVAVFGMVMFQDMRELKKLAKKFSLLKSKVKMYEEELLALRSTKYTFDSIISHGEAITELKREALHASGNQYPVLITGQSGTGKELFAQAIHHGSSRNVHPFVRINCAAIPKDLLESELFGYEKGAFTGANSRGKPGKFELADRGTIFLDEIGDMPLEMQPKLLRVLEEKEFEHVGGSRIIHSDFRIIAATNQDLEELMSEGRFRKDLFYRLNVMPLHIPPSKRTQGGYHPAGPPFPGTDDAGCRVLGNKYGRRGRKSLEKP